MKVKEIKENSKIVYNIMQGRPSIKIRLNDLETDSLFDTGAHVNIIDSKMIKTLGKVKLKTEINSDVRWIEFIVVE